MHPFGIISLFSRVLKYAVMHSNLIKIGILLYKLTDNFAFNENAQHKFVWRIDKNITKYPPEASCSKHRQPNNVVKTSTR